MHNPVWPRSLREYQRVSSRLTSSPTDSHLVISLHTGRSTQLKLPCCVSGLTCWQWLISARSHCLAWFISQQHSIVSTMPLCYIASSRIQPKGHCTWLHRPSNPSQSDQSELIITPKSLNVVTLSISVPFIHNRAISLMFTLNKWLTPWFC